MRRATSILALLAFLAFGSGVALAASSPTVSTGGVHSVSNTNAVVGGSVTPSGAPTSYSFEYGPTPALGTQGPAASAGSGKSPVAVKSTLTGLAPGTTYYYRLDASNGIGSAAGAIKAFRTTGSPPPTATTGAATGIATTSATLTGVINTQNAPTTYYFKYGLTTAYGLQTAPATVPPAGAPVPVSITVPGLAPGTIFHYQLVATHGSDATGGGQDASFETFPSPAPVPAVAVSTSPHRSRTAPFTFLIRGHLAYQSATPAALACLGSAHVSFLYGRRVVARTTLTVTPACTFSGGISLRRRPVDRRKQRPLRLGVIVHFRGNDYLAQAFSKKEMVTLG